MAKLPILELRRLANTGYGYALADVDVVDAEDWNNNHQPAYYAWIESHGWTPEEFHSAFAVSLEEDGMWDGEKFVK